jgi:TP901 family phage tail tape measure protein
VRKQLTQLNTGFKDMGKSTTASSRRVIEDMNQVEIALKQGNRRMAINSIRTLAMTQGFETASQAAKGFIIVLRDMFTLVGFINTAMSIMLSRFGTMIIIFGVITLYRKLGQAIRDSERRFDTASRKLQGIVIPTFGTLENAMTSLRAKMFDFTAQFGVSTEQLSDTMFFLASAGRTHAQILSEVEAVQKLVVATSKDMQATMQDNKVLVEAFVGVMNLYGQSVKEGADAQERAEHLASVLFGVFKTEQILITELATGLSFAANQARAMNISVEELIVSLAALNTSMIKGSKAGTSYANALRDAIKNSDKLQENFGINIGNIAEGFSFLETVVKPISELMATTSDLTAFNIRLLETFNIRGTRAVLALSNQYEKNSEKVRDLADANNDLNAAFQANADSMIQQEQRLNNLKGIYGFFFSTIVTGGAGQAAVLKQINNNIEFLTRKAARLTAIVTGWTSAIRLNYQVSLLRNQELLRSIPVIGRWFKQVVKGIDIAKGQIEAQTRINILMAFYRGELTLAEFEQELLNQGMLKTDEIMKGYEGSITNLIKFWKAYTDAMDEAISVQDEFGTISLPRFLEALKGNRELFAKFQAPSLLNPQEIEDFVKNLDRQLKFAERSFEETARVIDEKAFQKIREAAQSANDERKKLVGDKEQIAKQEELIDLALSANIIRIITDRELRKRELVKKSLNQQLDDIKDINKKIIDEQRRSSRLLRIMIGGVSAEEFLTERSTLPSVEDIHVLPTMDESALKRLETINEEVMKETQDRLNAIIKEKSGLRLEQHRGILKSIQNEEGIASSAIIKFWEANVKQLDKVTKVEKQRLLKLVDDQTEAIRKVIDESRQLDKNQIERSKNLAQAQVSINKKKIADMQIDALLSNRKLSQNEKDFIEELKLENDRLRETVINEMIAAWKRLQSEIDSETEKTKESIKNNIREQLDLANQDIEDLGQTAKQVFQDMTTRFDALSESFRIMSQIIAELETLTGDEQKQRLIELGQVTFNTVSRIIDIWLEYQITMNAVEAASARAAVKIAATLGVIGVLITAAAALVSIFKSQEEERNQLQQEFLDQNAQRAISPDYGQARVVNNRITLNPQFQLLDPRQLTPDLQRNIALTIFDEFQEIQKTFG